MRKFANDTDFVLISILVNSDVDEVTITDKLKISIKQQLATQIECSLEALTNVDMVRSGKMIIKQKILHAVHSFFVKLLISVISLSIHN